MLLTAVVEMPRHTNHKYEIKGGELFLDRVLPRSVPANYGYFPGTLEEDGDALDVFIYSIGDAILPKTRVTLKAVALIRGMDNGVRDDKLVGYAVPQCEDEKRMCGFIIDSLLIEITNYLRSYKEGFEVLGVSHNKKDIERAFKKSSERFLKSLETSYEKD